jgi:acyl-CoA thioester hydrolase
MATQASNANRPRCLQTRLDIRVGTYEIDYAGHVSNQVYLRWCEDLRLQLLEENFPLQELMESGFMPVLIASEIRYHRPVKLFDRPTGYMWIEKLSGIKMEFCGEFLVGDVLATSVKHTGLFVDSKTMKPTKLPPQIIKRFRDFEENGGK